MNRIIINVSKFIFLKPIFEIRIFINKMWFYFRKVCLTILILICNNREENIFELKKQLYTQITFNYILNWNTSWFKCSQYIICALNCAGFLITLQDKCQIKISFEIYMKNPDLIITTRKIENNRFQYWISVINYWFLWIPNLNCSYINSVIFCWNLVNYILNCRIIFYWILKISN